MSAPVRISGLAAWLPTGLPSAGFLRFWGPREHIDGCDMHPRHEGRCSTDPLLDAAEEAIMRIVAGRLRERVAHSAFFGPDRHSPPDDATVSVRVDAILKRIGIDRRRAQRRQFSRKNPTPLRRSATVVDRRKERA